MVLLIVHRAEQDGILEIHHFRHTTAAWAEEFALRGRGAVDHVVLGAEEFAEQGGFRREVGALGMRGEHAVLDVHARIERKLVDLAQNDRLVRRLLSVLAHDHRPARVERGVKIVVAAMDIQRVLRQRARADLDHHRRKFSRRMIILLHGVDDALAGSEIDRAPPRDRERRRPALRGVLAFCFNGDLLLAPDIEFTLGVGPLVNFAAFRGRRDWIKNAALGDAGFDVLGDQLVAVARHADTGVFGGGGFGRKGFNLGFLFNDRHLIHRRSLSITKGWSQAGLAPGPMDSSQLNCRVSKFQFISCFSLTILNWAAQRGNQPWIQLGGLRPGWMGRSFRAFR